MEGDGVSNITDGPDIYEERVYRTVLVKSLPPSTNKINLTIHFQSRKNGGGDIEELKLLDNGSAVITFEEEKVAQSVQKKEQKFDGVLLTLEQYKANVRNKEMENLQVFSKVSAMIDRTKLSLTMQETQILLKEIQDKTKVDIANPQNKRDVFILTGSFQQIQKSYHLLRNRLSKGAVCNGNASKQREDTSIGKDIPKRMQNGTECHMNGAEELELSSMKGEAKTASIKVNGRATTTSSRFSKTSKESSTSKKEGSSHDSNQKKTEKIFHTEITMSSKPSVQYPSQSGTKTFSNGKSNGPKDINSLLSRGKDNSEILCSPLTRKSSVSSKDVTVDNTHKIEISSKVWNVFVKIYEKQLQSIMSIFSVQIEPEDNHSMAIIKPSGECTTEKLKIATEKLKELYEEARSKMKLVRFVLADPENKEHNSNLRETVLRAKKDFPVFLERAEDRQSWEIFGKDSHVEKAMKLLEESFTLKRKEQNVDDETMEEAVSDDESDNEDDQNSDTESNDSADGAGEDDDDILHEKLEHHLEKVKVTVYRGDITEEKCDVIVNAANEKLEHGGGVASAIASKGGSSIQDECDRIVNAKGKLNVGDAVVSHSGYLKCKMIIHAVGPNWKIDKGEKGKALLKRACKEIFIQTEKYRFKSIAFPAISSGIFGMPKNICAQVMFDAIEEYSKSVPSTGEYGLRDIRFVNNDVKTVKVFRSEFKARYGSGKVIENKRDSIESGDLAYLVGHPSIGGDKSSNISPPWNGINETTIKTKSNETEFTKHYSKSISSSESHSRSQENGLSLLPRGGRPLKEDSSHSIADNMGKARHQNKPRCERPVREDSSKPLPDKMEQHLLQNQLRRGNGLYAKFKDVRPKYDSHSSKHGVFQPHFFGGGARPKQSQSQHTAERVLDYSSVIKTKQEDDVPKCSICLNEIKQPKTLPRCKHTFCKTCLDTALQQSPKCPYCRQPVTDKQSSPTHGHGTNGYRDDDFPFSGLDNHDDHDDDATLCLICAKPVRQAQILSCRHTYCKPCLDRVSTKCPCCSELERSQPSTHSWKQDPYNQPYSYHQGWMDMDSLRQFPPDFGRERPRSNRGNRPSDAQNFDGYQEQFGFPGASKRRRQPGGGAQPDGSMRDRQERFSLPGYEDYGTIVIQYSFNSGQQGPNHPNPGLRYEGTSRSAYLPDCPEGRKVLKLLRKAFDAGLLFKIGQSMTSKLDNQIIWADIPHKTSTSGGPVKYGYPDPAYLSDVKQQLKAALK